MELCGSECPEEVGGGVTDESEEEASCQSPHGSVRWGAGGCMWRDGLQHEMGLGSLRTPGAGVWGKNVILFAERECEWYIFCGLE